MLRVSDFVCFSADAVCVLSSVLNTNEVSDSLNVPLREVWFACRERKVPSRKAGRVWLAYWPSIASALRGNYERERGKYPAWGVYALGASATAYELASMYDVPLRELHDRVLDSEISYRLGVSGTTEANLYYLPSVRKYWGDPVWSPKWVQWLAPLPLPEQEPIAAR